MDLLDVVALVAAGFGAGTVNAVAGGGSLITFPTLVAVGLTPVAANVTNSISVCPGYLASVYGTRTDLADLRAEQKGSLLPLIPTAVLGSVAGCVLLLATPERAFELVVPFLVLGAAAVLAFQERIRAVVGHPHRQRRGTLHAVVGLGAVYGGYFGAALGVMLVAGIGLVLSTTLNRISALKNAVSLVVGLVTVVVFSLYGPVNWAAVGVLAPATLVGGYAGARLARRMRPAILRGVIVLVGGLVGVALLLRALS
jgi:uncharacterized membrane protein YfcA